MLNLTKLWCDEAQPADALRYGQGHGAARKAGERRPVVVWNITRRCNLRCVHCYSDSSARHYPGELKWEECTRVIEDLAAFKIPALLISGGEPTIHPRFFDIIELAVASGLRITISTNGTLLKTAAVRRLKQLGVSYVGISLDGIGDVHDQFRGRSGAFDRAVKAFRTCREVGQKSGLRLTLTRQTIEDLDRVLEFIETEKIPRVCFYHLVPSGRGANVVAAEPAKVRNALDRIIERVEQWHRNGDTREVLTVDQPADGAYLWMKLRERDPARAEAAWRLMEWNGGGANSSGVGIGNIDDQGRVHPDQFWREHTIGSVRTTPFSELWTGADPLLEGLRDRVPRLEGRCGSCRFKKICGGGFRVRAWRETGNVWEADPACYLSDQEISN